MSKTVKIDLSGDRLIAIAADMVDDHNYIGALKMLNKNAELTGNDEDSYMLYAEIFDDLGLYERSVHSWFKFMDIADFNDMSDCYEGLAVGYMNLGNEHFSAYYYNKLLMDSDDVDEEQRQQIVSEFLSAEENPLKFVYPPDIADVTEVMNLGVRYMKEGDFAKADEQFSLVGEGNPRWAEAQNYRAMCLIIADKNDEAEKLCTHVTELYPENVDALTTLAAVKTEAGKPEEAVKITEKLLSLKDLGDDEIYKIATVCCENKLHDKALEMFKKIGGDYKYDLNILYFKAIAAFNCKKFDLSLDIFDEISTIYPDAVTAQYWQNVARTMYKEGDWQELEYFYVLPQEVRQSSLKLLAAFAKLPAKDAVRLADEVNISGPVKWCFEDGRTAPELQQLAAHVAIKARLDDYVRDLLLHPSLPDALKVEILEELAARREDNVFGVVVCNVCKRITVRKIYIGRKASKPFVEAYSRLVSRFSILDDSYGEKFAAAAERLYSRLAQEDRLDCAKDVAALVAAVFEESGVRDAGITDKNLCNFFEVDEERLKKIRGER